MNEQEQLISGDQLGFGTEPEPDGASGAFEATGEGADDGKLARAEPAPAGSTSARISVRELTAGKIASIFRIDQVSEHKTKAGKPYMRLTFGDASGTIAAVCWDGVNEIIEFCKSGAIVAVQGEYEINERYGPQLTVRSVSAANEGDYDLVDLQDVPLFPYDKLEREFNELVGSVRDPHLTQVLARLLGPDTETGAAFMEMPAAKKNHQAYKHGLLEH
ncbi:MAG TPA: hypothetical protein VGO97_05375, partial [Solirubrobacterales bacterium]|nr:hypothetical protein [Solirubrobacterales bacterium]